MYLEEGRRFYSLNDECPCFFGPLKLYHVSRGICAELVQGPSQGTEEAAGLAGCWPGRAWLSRASNERKARTELIWRVELRRAGLGRGAEQARNRRDIDLRGYQTVETSTLGICNTSYQHLVSATSTSRCSSGHNGNIK